MAFLPQKDFAPLLTNLVLPSHDYLFDIADDVSSILEEEKTVYRQESARGDIGGLIDFQNDDIPLIVVPDMHGRRGFLLDIINYKLPKSFCGKKITIFEALKENLIRLIFVGDILHTELTTRERWREALFDFENGIIQGKAMKSEMIDSLNTWCGVFQLKINFPQMVHILKGNHENILNITSGGDYAFKKYADEGKMVRSFMEDYYGDDIVYLIHCVESSLPLMIASRYCVVSHAEPLKPYTKKQIINGMGKADVVEGLIWTNNGDAEEGSVLSIIEELKNKEINIESENIAYLAGHRLVREGNYNLRQNGRFTQIHNPAKENVALIYNDRKFNPEKDIVGVQK